MTLPLLWCAATLALANLVAFAAQGIDKRRATRNEWRISERTLLMLGLPLAAPGMFAGMRFFTHKTRKGSFLLKAAVVLAVNLAAALALAYLWHTGKLQFA